MENGLETFSYYDKKYQCIRQHITVECQQTIKVLLALAEAQIWLVAELLTW